MPFLKVNDTDPDFLLLNVKTYEKSAFLIVVLLKFTKIFYNFVLCNIITPENEQSNHKQSSRQH